MRRAGVLAVWIAIAGCAPTTAVAPVRFVNKPPVQVVNDRLDVPRQPAIRRFMRGLFHLDGAIRRPLIRMFTLPGPKRALGVTSIDEVPDSTWFSNRIGVRYVSPDEIRDAPGGVGSPELHRPWTIESTKVGGASDGFIVTDARGERWILKFDERALPEMETAAHVIVGKLLWAAGYNVSEDHVVYFRRDDLVLGEQAKTQDALGNKRHLEPAAVERTLARVDVGRDGRIRGLASRMLDGKPLGGHAPEGRRLDDRNDRIPHERRRDLRGLHALFAWLDHQDLHDGNYLDMWVEDERDPKRHYVKHYFIDFGKSLGVMSATSNNLRRGYEYYLDVPAMLGSLLTLGTVQREWERSEGPALRGVGAFVAEPFDPGRWKPTTPAYVPIRVADRFDNFWGAKLVMRFTEDQLRAAVDAARLTDRRAAEYLVATLRARQQAVGRYWFARVNPLDRFGIVDGELCFEDLALVHGLVVTPEGTRYRLSSYDRSGKPVGTPLTIVPRSAGVACKKVPLSAATDRYTIVRVRTLRRGFAGATDVHLARDPWTGSVRVIGLWRP